MEKKADLPHIPIQILGQELTALVDSGSAATLISSAAWSQMAHKPVLRPARAVLLRSVTGNLLPNQGEAELPINIGGHVTKTKVQIITGIPFQCILGIDFITKANLILRAAEQCVQVGMETVPFTARCGNYNGPRAVSTMQSVKIDPHQGVILCVRPDLRCTDKQIVEFAPLDPAVSAFPELQVAAVVAETSKNGLIQIRVTNPTNQTVELPAKTTLGTTTHFEGVVATVDLASLSPFMAENPPTRTKKRGRRVRPS